MTMSIKRVIGILGLAVTLNAAEIYATFNVEAEQKSKTCI